MIHIEKVGRKLCDGLVQKGFPRKKRETEEHFETFKFYGWFIPTRTPKWDIKSSNGDIQTFLISKRLFLFRYRKRIKELLQ